MDDVAIKPTHRPTKIKWGKSLHFDDTADKTPIQSLSYSKRMSDPPEMGPAKSQTLPRRGSRKGKSKAKEERGKALTKSKKSCLIC